MSLGEYLKMGLKKRVSRCGGVVEPFSLAQRTENLILQRRESRHSLISKKRNLVEMTLSPINSPIKPIKQEIQLPQVSEKQEKTYKRLEMLKQWQIEKQKRIEKEKLKQKPVFKVYHVTKDSNYNDFTKALKEIKGKPINVTKGVDKSKEPKLAPSSTHKFKPPANIKPIPLNVVKNTTAPKNYLKPTGLKNSNDVKSLNIRRELKFPLPSLKSKKASDKKSASDSEENLNAPATSGINSKQVREKPHTTRVTRSKTSVPQKESEGYLRSKKKRQLIKISSVSTATTKLDNDPINSNSDHASSESCGPISSNSEHSSSDSEATTPNLSKENRISSVYVSPYVTVSRGKVNARKEYHRKVKGESDGEGNSPKSAAVHFLNVVDTEMDRLNTLCEKWNNYKVTENPAEEACDMINVAIGQTALLLDKKFKQFRYLIDCCLSGSSEKPVTAFDLHGFWDTVTLQINNLDKRFDNLESLKQNNWEEILPAPIPKKITKGRAIKTRGTASSALMAAIKEARRKKKSGQEPEIMTVNTPKRRESRKNLRTSILTSETKRKISSPGLTIMRVTPFAKAIESPRTSQSLPKSILKSGRKSVAREHLKKTKAVLFRNDDFEDDLKENSSSVANTLMPSPDRSSQYTPRRSARILQKSQPRS